MRMLIMDDDFLRHETLEQRYRSYQRTHVYGVTEALKALETQDFDIALLDHDLGEGVLNGTDFAKALADPDYTGKLPAKVIVHSHNTPGAMRMVGLFQLAGVPAGHKPFRP